MVWRLLGQITTALDCRRRAYCESRVSPEDKRGWLVSFMGQSVRVNRLFSLTMNGDFSKIDSKGEFERLYEIHAKPLGDKISTILLAENDGPIITTWLDIPSTRGGIEEDPLIWGKCVQHNHFFIRACEWKDGTEISVLFGHAQPEPDVVLETVGVA
jgi:hypothetical protein